MKRVVHLTSVHKRDDTRIFLKECVSLAKAYSVSLVVADGLGDDVDGEIPVFDVGKSAGRMGRIFKTTKRVLQKALELDADLYHLHDPELLTIARKLKRKGKKVIFDAHEDLPKQILSKPYLGSIQAKFLSWAVSLYESRVCKCLDAIVTATQAIKEKFQRINSRVVTVNNYPMIEELYKGEASWSNKCQQVCYIGGISEIRGVGTLINAIGELPAASGAKLLALAGPFSSSAFEEQLRGLPGFSRVRYLGFLGRSEVAELLSKSIAGVVTFAPVPNHIDAQPNKMFEYMSAGIPVIASNFPLWREIIEGNNCGICVDPVNSDELSRAIGYLLENPEKAQLMGKNGAKAIREKYNWESEQLTLLSLYKEVFDA